MKGIFFSTILIFIIIFLVTFVSIQQELVSFHSSQRSVENRINAMLNFHDSIVFDSKKSLEIIGKRATSAAINYIIVNGSPLLSSNETIVELITEGEINGTPQSLMEGSTIRNWEDNIERLGNLQGFQTNVLIKNIVIQPADSFYLSISYSISINLSDARIHANMNKTSDHSLLLGIENLEDPIYPLNTFGRVVNIIKKSPHWLNYSSTDSTNLNDDLTNSYYHPSLYGASFLDRLEGKFFVQNKYRRDNYIGLESFVNKNEILYAGLIVNSDATNIDYFYFSGSNVPAYKISGMPSNFRLDNEDTIDEKTHLQIYNATVIS